MQVIFDKNKQRVPVFSWAYDLDATTLQQLRDTAGLDIVHHHVAAMADAHLGLGATIGSVFGTIDAVIPSAVGVDIGCGMCAMPTDNEWAALAPQADGFLKMLAGALFQAIPVGTNGYKDPQPWKARELYQGFDYESAYTPLTEEIRKESPYKLGTLGGGNHFIELQRDERGLLWIMVHSGSRHVGKDIADFYIKLAAKRNKEMHTGVPRDLSSLPMSSDEGRNYLNDMTWALNYAHENRLRMIERILRILGQAMHHFGETLRYNASDLINIHHNYAAEEEHFGRKVWLHRKGATRATPGLTGIIPGSMGSRSYIVVGKGNPDSFASCSHGAGRRMSRKEAFRTISQEALKEALGAVVVRHGGDVRDEAPQAYKDIDEVMRAQKDLVEIAHTLSPLAVIKG